MRKSHLFALVSALSLALMAPGLVNAGQKYMSSIPSGYAKSCTTCHSSVPALNATGVKFKNAGHSFNFAKPAPAPAKPAPKPATPAKPAPKPAAKPAAKPAPKPVAKLAPKPVPPSASEVAYKEWATTKHNSILEEEGHAKSDWPNFRGGSYNCSKCHAGEGFAAYVKDVKAAGGFNSTFSGKFGTTEFKDANITIKPYGPYPDSKAIASCDTCHENNALRITGIVGLQTTAPAGKPGYSVPLMSVNAGKAAACFICHDYRKSASFPASLDDPSKVAIRGPHDASQAEILLGFGGAEVEGEKYGSSPHAAIPNSCVTCHMAKQSNGLGGHTFAIAQRDAAGKLVKSNLNACTTCHPGLDTMNRLALGDYDGDKNIEGLMTEVDGLVAKVESATNTKLGFPSAKAISFGGQIFLFEDKAHTDAKDPLAKSLTHKAENGEWVIDVTAPYWQNPDAKKIYNALYNVFLIKGDSSHGMHNPVYTVQLLQKSYKDLMGSDIPGARIR